MLIEIPDNILNKSNLTENALKMEFALFLFNKNIMTLSQACNFANMDSLEFQKNYWETEKYLFIMVNKI